MAAPRATEQTFTRQAEQTHAIIDSMISLLLTPHGLFVRARVSESGILLRTLLQPRTKGPCRRRTPQHLADHSDGLQSSIGLATRRYMQDLSRDLSIPLKPGGPYVAGYHFETKSEARAAFHKLAVAVHAATGARHKQHLEAMDWIFEEIKRLDSLEPPGPSLCKQAPTNTKGCTTHHDDVSLSLSQGRFFRSSSEARHRRRTRAKARQGAIHKSPNAPTALEVRGKDERTHAASPCTAMQQPCDDAAQKGPHAPP